MAVFGRFDVYFPDGRVETYSLEGDTVSVGRAEGNTIALDTDTISRYHFSVTNKDGVVNLTDLDSANGTYLPHGNSSHGIKPTSSLLLASNSLNAM